MEETFKALAGLVALGVEVAATIIVVIGAVEARTDNQRFHRPEAEIP